jgi:hypothetical protein
MSINTPIPIAPLPCNYAKKNGAKFSFYVFFANFAS